MKRFKRQKLDRNDHRPMEILCNIVRIILTPMFLLVRIYCWVWDYDYYTRFKHPELMDWRCCHLLLLILFFFFELTTTHNKHLL